MNTLDFIKESMTPSLTLDVYKEDKKKDENLNEKKERKKPKLSARQVFKNFNKNVKKPT